MEAQITVLLIDDDPEEHELFCKTFQEFDHSVTCMGAKSCNEGYEMMKDKPPNCIVLDFNLPGTNGLACLRKIKKNRSFQRIPVYMFSAFHLQKDIIELCLEAGALKCVSKPRNLAGYTHFFSEIRGTA